VINKISIVITLNCRAQIKTYEGLIVKYNLKPGQGGIM